MSHADTPQCSIHTQQLSLPLPFIIIMADHFVRVAQSNDPSWAIAHTALAAGACVRCTGRMLGVRGHVQNSAHMDVLETAMAAALGDGSESLKGLQQSRLQTLCRGGEHGHHKAKPQQLILGAHTDVFFRQCVCMLLGHPAVGPPCYQQACRQGCG